VAFAPVRMANDRSHKWLRAGIVAGKRQLA